MPPDADRPWARRLLALITRTWFLVIAAVVVVLAVAYTLAGFFLVPRLIISYVPRYVQEQLKRRAAIREGRVKPRPFQLEVKHIPPPDGDRRALLRFQRLLVALELSSLFPQARAFAAIHLGAP